MLQLKSRDALVSQMLWLQHVASLSLSTQFTWIPLLTRAQYRLQSTQVGKKLSKRRQEAFFNPVSATCTITNEE